MAAAKEAGAWADVSNKAGADLSSPRKRGSGHTIKAFLISLHPAKRTGGSGAFGGYSFIRSNAAVPAKISRTETVPMMPMSCARWNCELPRITFLSPSTE